MQMKFDLISKYQPEKKRKFIKQNTSEWERGKRERVKWEEQSWRILIIKEQSRFSSGIFAVACIVGMYSSATALHKNSVVVLLLQPGSVQQSIEYALFGSIVYRLFVLFALSRSSACTEFRIIVAVGNLFYFVCILSLPLHVFFFHIF